MVTYWAYDLIFGRCLSLSQPPPLVLPTDKGWGAPGHVPAGMKRKKNRIEP